jgi:hypothetical protein
MIFSAFDGTQRFVTVRYLKQHANGPYHGSDEFTAHHTFLFNPNPFYHPLYTISLKWFLSFRFPH